MRWRMTADGIDVTKAFTAGAPVSPELFRMPTPAPPSKYSSLRRCPTATYRWCTGPSSLIPHTFAVFEWRQHVQQKLSNMEDELMHLRRYAW